MRVRDSAASGVPDRSRRAGDNSHGLSAGTSEERTIDRLLTEELRGWIGREVSYAAPEEIGHASIRYFALAIGDDNPLYVDEAYARAAGYPSIVAPPTFVCETCQYAHRPPNEDGYIGHTWELPIAGCRMIRGGHEYEFFRRVLPEDRINVTWRLEDISEHRTSRGEPMLMVISAATYRDQRGDLLARNRETLIFQPLESSL
jgi:acyl dehydratase